MLRRLSSLGPADSLALVCLLLGFYHGTGALIIEAKARLAPVLIERAWRESLAHNGHPIKPWPWADTWPVGRLQVPAHHVDLPVLAGDSGNALAFAPGHATRSAAPGSDGLAVIGGHRDTHFSFLRDVKTGDVLHLQSASGAWRDYRVDSIDIVDSRDSGWEPDAGEGILLVTCYPFDSLRPNGPLRYLVRATPAKPTRA